MAESIHFFGNFRNRLGESPVWDAEAGLLYWVDTVACRVYSATGSGDPGKSWMTASDVGSIGLAVNGLVAALRDGFHLIADARIDPIFRVEHQGAPVRFNDGKTDRSGRFLAGTMRIGVTDGAPGKLYRLDSDGHCAILETDIQISNSLCFSPSGDRMYFADSLRRVVWAYDYDLDGIGASNRVPLIDTSPFGSVPDGATVDADGNIWLALVQAQKIAQFAPDGRLLRAIELPVPFPSCPAFGGEGLETLFITTIQDSGNLLRTDHPDGGRMLAIEGLGASGIQEARWMDRRPICRCEETS